MKRVPDPRKRPTEYAVVLVASVLALVGVFVDLPDGLHSASLGLVAVLAPLVTLVVSRREQK